MCKFFNSMDNYPPGAANDPNAPYNQESIDPIEREVTVSITLSKTFTIEIDDYEKYADEGGIYYDTSCCDLEQAVKDQITLPQNAYKFVDNKYAKKDLKGWNIDEFEVIKE